MIGKSKEFLDKVFSDEPRRDLASVAVMRDAFPNYYDKYQIDPAELSPQDYYNSIMQRINENANEYSRRSDYNGELAKDIYGDPTLNPQVIDPKIRRHFGFRQNEIPILPLDEQAFEMAHFNSNEKHIRIKALDPLERAGTLMHEFQHAKDEKYEPFDSKGEFSPESQIRAGRLWNVDPQEALTTMSRGHHKQFQAFSYDFPQHTIAKEHINQKEYVNPAILDKFPDLKRLRDQNKPKRIKQFIDPPDSTIRGEPGAVPGSVAPGCGSMVAYQDPMNARPVASPAAGEMMEQETPYEQLMRNINGFKSRLKALGD